MTVHMMKKRQYSELFLCLLGVLIWCWLMPPPPAFAVNEAVGEVVRFAGTVRIEREGVSRVVRLGEAVHLRDRLQTGPDSRAEILFVDESRVRLAPDTTLEITEYLFDPENKRRQSLLSLWSGKARFMVTKFADYVQKGFEVRTPEGTAGVRGTDFIIEVKKVEE